MEILRDETLPLMQEDHIVKARQVVRVCAQSIGLGLVDQTKLVTAASELARNTLRHGHGGEMHLQILSEGLRKGVRLEFIDRGPGIPDVELALKDGYTSAGGMGLGLGGAKRLVDDFEIETKPGEGTRVCATRWKL